MGYKRGPWCKVFEISITARITGHVGALLKNPSISLRDVKQHHRGAADEDPALCTQATTCGKQMTPDKDKQIDSPPATFILLGLRLGNVPYQQTFDPKVCFFGS